MTQPCPAIDIATSDRSALRQAIRTAYLADEAEAVVRLIAGIGLSPGQRHTVALPAAHLVSAVRAADEPGIMPRFLAEYGLTSREGVALMCLAEALLRVPDAETVDALISDKIAAADWGRHLGHSSSSLVNASTWALLLTGRVVAPEDEDEGLVASLHGLLRRLGEPVVRAAVSHAMRELGQQFVLGRNIEEAAERAQPLEAQGYTYSYDMLGEAARTEADARRYHLAYSGAIAALAGRCTGRVRDNPGISVKLSALYPRYEYAQAAAVRRELTARTLSLALLAKSANMGFNIDAEEAERLDLSLDIIAEVLSEPALAGWNGFGVVVQAYGQRAPYVIDWLYDLAGRHDRRLMVRLVKGAYWDSEIKRAQTLGLAGFPVFTRKLATDVSYLACASKLLAMTDRLYPQFATHNAHTVMAVLEMAGGGGDYEFQRLHGMGDMLHDIIRERDGTRCRIYAPVGAHRDLLAYLVRRLLENGANSSFVNQMLDESVAPETVARDPVETLRAFGAAIANPAIRQPAEVFAPERRAAKGWDLSDPATVEALEAARQPFRTATWPAGGPGAGHCIRNPADADDIVGSVVEATAADIDAAFAAAVAAFPGWAARPVDERAACLERLADLYETHAAELMALATREAGKTLPDAVAEVREAVDYCRYYAARARELEGRARGVFVCISPWNFPLAIFSGQVTAALVAGNAVLAKPAEQTPLIAARAVELMYEAGVPRDVLYLLPGEGPGVGARLSSDARLAGACFTGSLAAAHAIDRAMAEHAPPDAPLIAETGGLNAMIVDSTALPEQAVRDILASAFNSAGQRCSALRMLYVQKDVEARTLAMLAGAMETLVIGDPWRRDTDIGPVIDAEAREALLAHGERMERQDRLVTKLPCPAGLFVAPAVYRVSGIDELEGEVFGPILHVARYEAADLEAVIAAINAKGYGLTFGLHTRVDARVQQAVERLKVGNLYVNRNQIGAVVGSQPFGGEGLSGTGPKAGGPHYLSRFVRTDEAVADEEDGDGGETLALSEVQAAIDGLSNEEWAKRMDRAAVLLAVAERMEPPIAEAMRRAVARVTDIGFGPIDLPGPTGESNRLWLAPKGVMLCLNGAKTVFTFVYLAAASLAMGNTTIGISNHENLSPMFTALRAAGAPAVGLSGRIAATDLTRLSGIDAVAAADGAQRDLRRALAAREGAIVGLVTEADPRRFAVERVLSIDTTAAGGNATLLAAAGD